MKYCVALAMGLVVSGASARANDANAGVQDLMRMIPSDFPVSIVVADFEQFDRTVIGVGKRLWPDAATSSILDDLKSELDIGKWVDFSKPFAMASPIDGSDKGAFWAAVPDFAVKVKSLDGAKEEDGVWELSVSGRDTLFATQKGDYVVVATNRATLAKATRVDRSLAEEIGARAQLMRDRLVLVHLNMEPIRPMALGGMAQAAQMAPMLAMMSAQQGGGDPASMTAMFTTLFDAAERFVAQLRYLELMIGIDADAVDVALLGGFIDGPIREYLVAQKPSRGTPFKNINEQPFAIAVSTAFPGKGAPVVDYVFDKMSAAMESAAGIAGGTGNENKAASAIRESLHNSKEMYRQIQGFDLVFSAVAREFRMIGDSVCSDPQKVVRLQKEIITNANPLMQQFNAGVTYESLGTKQIGGATIDTFRIKVDTTNPAAATMLQMYGSEPRFALGTVGDRVRFYQGCEEYMTRAFTEADAVEFTSTKLVADALARMPEKRNAVVLVDPAAFLPLVGPMIGMSVPDSIAPGPPAAISAALFGDFARMDIHVPVRAVERVIQAVAPPEPM